MQLRPIEMIEDETPTGEISMAAITQGCRATAKAAVAEVRRSGCALTEEEARELETLIEKEILKAITARKAADALNVQLKESLRSLRKFVLSVDAATRETHLYAG